jgi:hypothetical protein
MRSTEGAHNPRSQLRKVLLTFGLVGAFIAAMLQLKVGDDAPPGNAPVAAGVDVSALSGFDSAQLSALASQLGTPSSTSGTQLSSAQLAALASQLGTPSSSGAPSSSSGTQLSSAQLAALASQLSSSSTATLDPSNGSTPLAAVAAAAGTPTSSGTPSSSSGTPSTSTGSSSTGSSTTGTTGTTGVQAGTLDTAAAILGVKFGRNTLSLVLRNGFVFTVTCNEPCDITAVMDMARQLARRLGIAAARTVVVGRKKTSLTRAGSKRVVIKLTKKAKRRLRRLRRGRRVKLRLRVDTKDRSGNRTKTFGRNLTLKR